ncbi:NADPH-dependent FMN reductase [Actinokineospora bangkokensis]|uniref:NADPH-dependent FMN reductase-like domain-containing protein n=1 Tax=Actinokineospora bangkokensis TaxID=1193682 RepID=A0A1Q9LE02_9PSEU|nr:NAD(P)H-dependent oxidoreductase [Actinokineospora bangkokensis]OLR90235.1 hypothetical protein BJP25_04590 [Actinokineospora bangkokensis]
MPQRPALAVITASTRDGRFGPVVADWFSARAEEHGAFAVRRVDLADPALDFPAAVDSADAFAVVTPEYNHGYPGPLKEAVDSVHTGWIAKPVGFVSYGGLSGGLRAVEQLRVVFAELHAVTVRDTVSFHGAHVQFREGRAQDADPAAKKLLTTLHWWASALVPVRGSYPA